MLDDRALTVNTASRHIDSVPLMKVGPRRVTRVSRWGIIAALQVVEALVTATISGVWLAMILSGAGVRVNALDLAAFGLAAAVIVHVGLRSRGAYDFADILDIARSSKMAVWAWIVSTGPLLVVPLLLVPEPAVMLGWL